MIGALPKAVTIVSRPRLHIGLVNLSELSARRNCGVGFSINSYMTSWHLRHSDDYQLNLRNQLDDDAQRDLTAVVCELRRQIPGGPFNATLEHVAPQHIGFGTKTSLCMSLIHAVYALKGQLVSPDTVKRLSKRGGTSGVGINLFYCGGVVWDGGHESHPNIAFLPSSAIEPQTPPPLLGRWHFPKLWKILLILPSGFRVSAQRERDFFRSNTPVTPEDFFDTMAAMYHGIIPSIATANLPALRIALRDLHKVGFKNRELNAQSPSVNTAMESLFHETQMAIGMSSMGPLLYGITNNPDVDRSATVDVCNRLGAEFLGLCDGWNSPYEITLNV